MQPANIPGLALALTGRDRLLHVSTYGLADLAARSPVEPGTLFEIGSISKSFTDIALLQLEEQGLVDLQAPVTRYLPWFEVQSAHEPITLHHLMTHSAGIITGSEFSAEGRHAVWTLRETETGCAPGRRFHYSNDGYKTLGVILEDLLGQPYGEIVQRCILDPLGMAATEPVITHDTRHRLAVGYGPFYDDRPLPRGGLLAPAMWMETATGDGSIASTAADMAIYVRMLLRRGEGPGGRLISERSFERMIQPFIRLEEGEQGHYGYGLEVREQDGVTVIGHSGGMVGYRAQILADLDQDLGVVVLVNGPGDAGPVATFALAALRAAVRGEGLPALPAPEPMEVDGADGYAGLYRGQSGALEVKAEQGRLFLVHDGERVPLEPRGQDAFYVPHPDFERFLLRFGRQEGEVAEAFFGPDWYGGDRYRGPADFESPREWLAYTGHYRSYNPWYSNFRVVLRKGRLVLSSPDGEEQRLVPLGGGYFRLGEEEHTPERVRFDTLIDGRATHAHLSGTDYYRTFTP